MELDAIIDFVNYYRLKKITDEHPGFTIVRFLTTTQMYNLYQTVVQKEFFLWQHP